MYNPVEIWKEFPLHYENTNFYRVEVSNFGRVKTYNSARPEGGIVKGTLQGGYPIVRITLFKERPSDVREKIAALNELIAFLEARRRELIKERTAADEYKTEIEDLKKQKLAVVAKRKKYIQKTDQKRKIFVHFLIHRAVAELFLERADGQDTVIHKDFNKENNNAANLQWVSREEAYSRFADHPIYKESTKGVKRRTSGNAKLTVENVLYIKEKLNMGKSLRELAHHFKVSDMQIHRIKTGENWSSVKTLSEIKKENKKHKKWQAT